MYRTSNAAFTASTGNGSNSFSTGTVTLSSAPVSSVFTVSGLKPGSTGSACVTVSYTGSLESSIRMFASAFGDTNSMGSYITFKIEQTAGAGTVTAPSCTGYGTALTLYDFSMASLSTIATGYSSGLGSWVPSGAATRDYRITYTLSSSAPNTVQGSTASITLTWEAQNTESPQMFASRGGGTSNESASVEMFADGSSAVGGYFQGTSPFGATSLVSAGSDDAYVARLDAAGNWAWAVRGGGAGDDGVSDVGVLADGSTIATGWFSGTATFGSTTLTSAGDTDIWVGRLDASGNWVWAARGGGTEPDSSNDLVVFPDGTSAIVSSFLQTVTFGVTTLTSAGDWDGFVARLNADGTWNSALRVGGTGYEAAYHVAGLPDRSLVVAGNLQSVSGFTLGSTSLSSASPTTWVASLSSSDTWTWAIQPSSSSYNEPNAATTGYDGTTIIAGNFTGSATFGSTMLTSAGQGDVYVAAIDHTGAWQWAVRGGGTGEDTPEGVAVRYDGSVVVTGSLDDPATFGATTLTRVGGTVDTFVAALDRTGAWSWASQLSSVSDMYGSSISILRDGTVTVAGSYIGTLTAGSSTLVNASVGWYDVYAVRLDASGQFG